MVKRTRSAIATAARPAAGRSAQHRATVPWREGAIHMRRFGVIVATGVLQGMSGGLK